MVGCSCCSWRLQWLVWGEERALNHGWPRRIGVISFPLPGPFSPKLRISWRTHSVYVCNCSDVVYAFSSNLGNYCRKWCRVALRLPKCFLATGSHNNKTKLQIHIQRIHFQFQCLLAHHCVHHRAWSHSGTEPQGFLLSFAWALLTKAANITKNTFSVCLQLLSGHKCSL